MTLIGEYPGGVAVAQKSGSTFSQTVTVTKDIAAPVEVVWALLTDAGGFPAWNTTVTSIDGPIELGRPLRIMVPVSKRAFTPKVSAMQAPTSMTWSDGRAPMFTGSRVFQLASTSTGTRFTMTETFKGVMFPMIKRTLPDFVPIFDQYAADLAAAAEQRAQEHDR